MMFLNKAMLCAISILLFIILFNFNITASDCPNNRELISNKCYGECGNFIDANNNKICDIWEKYHSIKSTPSITNNNNHINDNMAVSVSKPKILKYGILWILLTNIFLIFLGEFISKKISIFLINSIWNWILLLSFVLCSISGFSLYFNFFSSLKKYLFALHLQSGAVLTITSLYHVIKRMKCIWPIKL
ncbi:MAG: hypothetical protein GX445_00295 [Elusimicrobia bacterium]|nr:hypothetical protein [Elusimicrobiota bacterium]